MLAFYGLSGRPIDWNGITVYPGGADGFGNDVLAAYALHHFKGKRDAGWIIALQDAWTLKAESLRTFHMAVWAPVDHYNAPPNVVDVFNHFGAVPLAMSQHGFDAFERAGLKPFYVPHGIDTKVFRPIQEVRPDGREILGIPQDAFCFGMVANNNGTPYPSRKSIPEVLQAFKVIHERHPDTFLYLHTQKNTLYRGMDIEKCIHALELPADSYGFVDQFGYTVGEIESTDMPGIYACIDVLVNPAMGEGFGMPSLEAQACGVPVILADNTAQTELCHAGWLVPSYKHWDPLQFEWWGRVHVPELIDAMETAYQGGQQVRMDGREWAVKTHDEDMIAKRYWKPTLKKLEGMLEAPKAKPVDLAKL
jgi:glycosyltransferase involved in cell wall biosynthesis